MTQRLAIVVSLLAALLGLPVAAATADDYVAGTATRCSVATPEVVRVGNAFRATVSVDANSTERPSGEVQLTVSRNGAGPVYSLVADYRGGSLTLRGRPLTQVGDYTARLTFSPTDDSVFRGCQDTAALQVTRGALPDDDQRDDQDQGPGGLLPDTGGPDFWLLLLGLGLVGTGGTLVVAARRQRPVLA